MNLFLHFAVICTVISQLLYAVNCKLVCHYDTTIDGDEGPTKLTPEDMKNALQFCTHVIYDYASISPKTFVIANLTPLQEREFGRMEQLKKKYSNVQFLLSISDKMNTENINKFLQLLEGNHRTQQTFVSSAVEMVRKYKFDGLSLDFPLPTEEPVRLLSYGGKIWEDIKHFFGGRPVVDAKAKEHKEQMTDLILQLSTSLKQQQNLILTLTVMPNVNSKWYFDAPAIVKHLDFVVLATFDFYTPQRNPEEANYVAPINGQINRLPQSNVDYQVNQWLSQNTPNNKIIVGVATWGHSWKITKNSKHNTLPPIFLTEGPAESGAQTHSPGFLSWPEICQMLNDPLKKSAKPGDEATLRRMVDPTKKYGNYAYRPADKHGNHGVWISYEEPKTAALKADYVKSHNLGGVALFNLNFDDLRGQCTGEKYPILRSIQFKLLQ